MRFIPILVVVLFSGFARSQFSSFGMSVGLSHYYGDIYSDNSLQGGLWGGGLTYRYHKHPYYNLKIGLSYLPVYGADSLSGDPVDRRRNLSFRNNLLELQTVVEVNLSRFDPLQFDNSSPYVFGGGGVLYHSPYTYLGERKYALRPMGTEGQLLPGEKGMYSIFAPFIVAGIGARLALSTRLHAGFEIGFRFTSTDYLDDASTRVPDYKRLQEFNETAAALSYRTPEVTNSYFKPTGRIRGNPENKDGYRFMGFHVSYSLSKSKEMSFREKFERQRAVF